MSDGQRDGRPSIDFAGVRANHPLHEVIASYGVALRRAGTEYIGRCPFHADGEPSLTVFRGRDGHQRYHCFACGEHGDVIDFVRGAEHCSAAEAVRRITGNAASRPTLRPPERDPAQDWTPADPATAPPLAPDQTGRITVWNPKRGRESTLRATHLWPYRDAGGRIVCYVARCMIEGRKWTPTITWATGPATETDPHPAPRYALVRPARPYPPLGIGDLQARPSARVLIVSGERCHDTAAELFPERVILTWIGGDQAVELTDWSGLAGRQVTVWPDDDASGRRAAERLAAITAPLATAVRVVQTAGDTGDDVCDYVERDGMDRAAMAAWLSARVHAWAPAPPPVREPDAAPPPAPEPTNVVPIRPSSPPALALIEGNTALRPRLAADEGILPAAYTEDAVAREFVRAHGGGLRWIEQFGQWYAWDGERWREDKTRTAFELARDVCCRLVYDVERKHGDAATLPDSKRGALIQKYGSLTAVRAVETFAKSQLALTPDAWDADDMMLNTPGGVIDLSTGAIIEGASARDMLCTKLAGTTAAPAGSPTPLWDRFLRDVTDGNADLIAYLQRIAGYTLTGLTHEHGLMFVHGSGGNGKSVFLNVLQDVMGSYSHTAQMTTFTESKFDRHPTEIAALRGARLVTAQETEEGRYWAEAKIKELTGGTRISARFMRQDEFTFQPKFKLVIAGNHRPRLRNPDEAMKRRIHLIPFTVTIRDKDTGLQDKLRAEYPAILRWAIDGCIEWQRIGLAMPDVVRTATDEYLASEDKIRQWLADCIDTTRRDDAENKAQLYKSYKRWSEDAGHPWPMDKSRWYAALQAMGYSETMTGSGQRVIRGLRFLESDTF